MSRTKRDLYVAALDALLKNRVASVVVSRDWDLIEEVARIAQEDAPVDLAFSDPSRYIALRNAVTQFHLRGWTHMTPERVRQVATREALRLSAKKSDAAEASIGGTEMCGEEGSDQAALKSI